MAFSLVKSFSFTQAQSCSRVLIVSISILLTYELVATGCDLRTPAQTETSDRGWGRAYHLQDVLSSFAFFLLFLRLIVSWLCFYISSMPLNSRSNQGNLNYATWPFFLKSLQLVTKNVGTGRNQHDTLYIILAASIGARQFTFLE